MPSYKGWEKLDTSNPAWNFNRKILVEGHMTEVTVHAYRQGASVNDPEDYWAELYFSNAEVENMSIKIDGNGDTSNYAQPESSITAAEENCREFLRNVHDSSTIRDAARATQFGDIKEQVREHTKENLDKFGNDHADWEAEAWNVVEDVLRSNDVDISEIPDGQLDYLIDEVAMTLDDHKA